jgi:hypothetical protein
MGPRLQGAREHALAAIGFSSMTRPAGVSLSFRSLGGTKYVNLGTAGLSKQTIASWTNLT